MALPGYAAAMSLYPTSRSYREARSGLTGATSATIVAQHDPCNRGGGGGGGGFPPGPCPPGRKCCGAIVNGRCDDQCIPVNASCP
jgi:hypothetical protein